MRFLQQVFFAIVRIFPVLSYCTIPGFFNLSIDSVETKHPKNHNPKRGQRLKPRTRAKAKGQSSDGSTRGILKGGIIRAGASYSPLEPASLLTFLPEQESKAPAGSARSQFRTEIFCESLLPLQCPVSFLRCMVGYRQPPTSTAPSSNQNCIPRWLPQSPAVTALSRREPWGAYLSTWVCAFGKCLL